MVADELAELIDMPDEKPNVEYKAWLDISDHKHRANLARHIAAIANYGGGYIVFGVNDDKTACTETPEGWTIDHDILASISKKYHDPVLHCEVRKVTSTGGQTHHIIVVPPHGAVPICAKANGPDNGKGKPEGIIAGTYYLRKPGPESVPITTSADWRDVIRRCAMHDRSAILAAVTAALTEVPSDRAQPKDKRLSDWAKMGRRQFLQCAGNQDFVVPLSECHMQFSYRVRTSSGEQLDSSKFADLLGQIELGVDEVVQSGWSLFHVFTADKLAPRWAIDHWDKEDDIEFLEANYIYPDREFGFDLWRVAPEGFATTLREYWEDTPDRGGTPKTALDPKLMARTLGEFVRHAEVFSAFFHDAEYVEFECEWWGLTGRTLQTPYSTGYHASSANTDHVKSRGAWPVGTLGAQRASIVAELGGRLLRSFNWTMFTPRWIESLIPSWTRF